jgi:5-deoxy-glucuronate isomerase
MVIGEIITWPGKWSSYPPHAHRHPEIYHYRFCPTTGFGVSFIGDQPHLTRDGYTTYISGDLTHAQCAAPGYAMYYIWVIRHLPGDPWIRELSTTIEPEHRWMIEPKAHIWNRPAE